MSARMVDLPAPLGPTRAVVFPAGISRETPERTGVDLASAGDSVEADSGAGLSEVASEEEKARSE